MSLKLGMMIKLRSSKGLCLILISKEETLGKDLLVFIKSMKSFQVNLTPLEEIKKNKNPCETDNTNS
jgi:hypothetical protein